MPVRNVTRGFGSRSSGATNTAAAAISGGLVGAVSPVGTNGLPSNTPERVNIQNSLDPFTEIQFDRNRDNLRFQAGQSLAELGYNRGLSGLRRTRSIRDLTRTFNESRARVNPTFARRGLLNSGIKNRALRLMREQRDRTAGNIDFEFGIQSDGFDRAEANINDTLTRSEADIELERQFARARLAAALSQANGGT